MHRLKLRNKLQSRNFSLHELRIAISIKLIEIFFEKEISKCSERTCTTGFISRTSSFAIASSPLLKSSLVLSCHETYELAIEENGENSPSLSAEEIKLDRQRIFS